MKQGRGRTIEAVVDVKVGDVVYLYQDREKVKGRSKYMVTRIGEGQECIVQKFTDKQFRGKKYRVRRSDLIKVHQHPNLVGRQGSESEDEYLDCLQHQQPDISEPEILELSQSDTSVEDEESSTSDEERETDEDQAPEEVDPGDNAENQAPIVEAVEPPNRVRKKPVRYPAVEAAKRPNRSKKRPVKLADYVELTDSESN